MSVKKVKYTRRPEQPEAWYEVTAAEDDKPIMTVSFKKGHAFDFLLKDIGIEENEDMPIMHIEYEITDKTVVDIDESTVSDLIGDVVHDFLMVISDEEIKKHEDIDVRSESGYDVET